MSVDSSESTPLLAGALDKCDGRDDTTFRRETRVLLELACPLLLMNFLRFSVQGVTVLTLARLGTRELAASNLGLITSNCFGMAIIIGLIGGLDTLANQAARSSSPKLTSIYCMRTFVVCCMVMPFLFLLLWNLEPIFSLVMPRADPQMLRLASDYSKVSSLALPPLAAMECIRRYCQAFGKVAGPAIGYSLAAPLSIFLTYLFVFGPEPVRIGFLGAPLAVVVSYFVLFLVMLVYAWAYSPRHGWAGVSRTIFEDLGTNWRFGLAGIASTISEWWAFDAIGIGSSYLGEVAQATSAIFNVAASFGWQIPLSLSMAISIRIGNLLGANMPHRAKKAAYVAQIISLAVVVVTATFLQVFRKEYGRFFTHDPAVIAEINRCSIVVAMIAIFDGLQGAATGVLRGSGQPSSAANINLVSYWMVGLPLGALITYRTLDLAALWGGLVIAVATAAGLMTIKIVRIDWVDRAAKAQKMLAESDAQAHITHSEQASREV